MHFFINKEEQRVALQQMLKNNVVLLMTTKTDESKRNMYATLQEDKIQPVEKKTKRVKKENPDVQSVWDVEAEGWRSFRWDRLHAYSLVTSAEELGLR